MSHTSFFNIEGYGRVQVIHDGDWSGYATIYWTDDQGQHHKEVIPGPLLLRLAGDAAKQIISDKIVAFLDEI